MADSWIYGGASVGQSDYKGETDTSYSVHVGTGILPIIGIEAGGRGLDSKHGASLAKGSPGVLHGQMSYLLQDEDGQILEAHSISAGLDYPGIGPEHAWLKELGRVTYDNITDREALDAFVWLSQDAFVWLSQAEGIIPAFESSHAIAYLKKMPPEELAGKLVLINLSGRGDKDMIQAKELLDFGGAE